MLVCVMIMGVTLCVEAQATPFAVGSYVKYYPTQTKVDLSALTGITQDGLNPSETTDWRVLSNDGTKIELVSAEPVGEKYS